MNLQELFSDFDEIQQKKEKLQREIMFLDKLKETRLEILRSSIIFESYVVNAIAKLMSKKENERYVPFVYNRILHLFASDDYNVDNYYVGITKYDNVRTLEKGDNIRNTLESGGVYTMFLIESDISDEDEKTDKYVSMYDSFSKSNNGMVLFKFLSEEYNINSSHSHTIISRCNFEGHEYVKDYIRYLVDLQVQNNGKRLTYEEMINAIYEFLNMNNEEVKKLIR